MNASSSASIDSKFNSKVNQPDLKARLVMRLLKELQYGTLELTLPSGEAKTFMGKDSPSASNLRACMKVHDWRALSMAVSRGDIGFGEGYMQGLWTTPDLGALLRLVAQNRKPIEKLIYGNWWATVMDQIRHLLRSNRKSQARKNISAHYDLGNDFYRLWLDASMSYSSALFDGTGLWGKAIDLKEGQIRKIDRAISELGNPKSVLEIGCGWGGLASRLIEQKACAYVGLTLSVEQQAWARRVLDAASASSRAEIRLQDYRDTQEQFDGIVSIEMFEAVGERYWDTYFQTIKNCLKPSGRAVIQTITIDESLFDRYRKGTDFIQQYIFPGGMLPTKTAFIDAAKKAGLSVDQQFFFGQDYARTLYEWRATFDGRLEDIHALSYDESFMRMWRFYLAYCEAGFRESNIDVGQFTLIHAG